MRLYVGNLPYQVEADHLKALFSQYGDVRDSHVVMDRETRRSRGFGFVELDDDAARSAMEALDGHELDGRKLVVNEAQERREGGGGGGGGRGGNRGGGGGGGGRW